MSLLNGALAFGALAFTIPLVIHLFFRSRFKTLDWGAMYLLESVVRINRRRMQVTNLLLLLLRCAIPILLAFCLARPVWTGLRALAGDAPKTLVIAIDDSRSMSVIPPGEASRIEVAKREIRSVLEDLTRRDEVILVRSSRLGAIPSKMGVSEALAKLRKIDANGNAVSVGKLIDAASVAAAEGSYPRRQILLVSDFQANAVDASTIELAGKIAETNRLATESGSGDRLIIDFLDVGKKWEDLPNVSVDEVAVSSPVIVSNRAGVYTATIRNASDLPANDLRLVWSIDGKPLEPRVISIEAKSTVTNRLTHTIGQPGMHEIAATIDRGDALTDDNRRSLGLEVMEEINVLLVDGAPSSKPLGGQADFLAIALSPFAFGGDDRPDPVRATVGTTRRIQSALNENEIRVIILCGVGQLSDADRTLLADFVHDGGSLIVFDGPRVRGDLYNQVWKSEGRELRFPATTGELVGDPAVELATATETFAMDTPAMLYQPWRILGRGEENPLNGVKLSAYRSLKLLEVETSDDENSTEVDGQEKRSERYVLLRTTDGDPLAVLGNVGDGFVVQFGISGNDAWTNLPLRPVFLPLVQQLVLDLAGKKGDAMIGVGQPIVIPEEIWPKPSVESDGRTRTSYIARTPRGDVDLETPSPGAPIRMTATYEPGIYRIRKQITNIQDPEKSETAEVMRIATVDASESMLVDIAPERLESLAGILDANVFENAAILQEADRSRAFGREIWRWLLALLLIALVLELWLQQNLIRRRATVGGTA